MMKLDWFGKFQKATWAVFLMALPVTSFPFFPSFSGSSVLVRPLALYPLFVLLIIVVLPRTYTRRLPGTLIPFFIFVLAALISTAYAFTRGINPTIDVSMADRTVRTLATLAFGGLFYISVSLVPQNKEDLRFTLKWLYAGFGVALVWASFQIVYVIWFNQSYFNFLNDLQSYVSIRRLFDKRISGMTYEPSWFAEQLTFVLMPWLFASILSKYSAFRWRLGAITVEAILLAWSSLALLFTYSRGGLALFAILLVIVVVIGLRRKYRHLYSRPPKLLKMILQVSLVVLVLAAVVFVAAQKNNYFSRLWGYWTDEESEGTYFNYIAFSQRLAYWETAYRIFEDYPFLGIGLGNFTFYFDEYLPDKPIRDPEIFSKLVPDVGRNQVVTVKNYLIRILAETGLLGISAYTGFLLAIVGCVVFLLLSPGADPQFWGIAGLLGLVAFIPVTLSVDSFAIPNIWVVFGIITASAKVITQDASTKDGTISAGAN